MKRIILIIALAAAANAQMLQSVSASGSVATAATPTFSPAAGAVSNPTTVTISTTSDTCSSYIHHNTTGAPVLTSDPTGTYSVTGAVTVYAAVLGCPGYKNSAVGSAAYTISGGGGTWTLVQHVVRDNPVGCQSATSCAFTNGVDGFVTPTAGNVGIILAGTFTALEFTAYNGITNGGTWTEQTGAEADLTVGSAHTQWIAATTLSLVADSTITLNFTVAPSGATFHFIELHWSGSTTAVDVVDKNTRATCTSCAGLALTLTGSADVIIQGIAPENGCTSITGGAGYTSFGDFASFGNALAGQINTTTATAPTWTCSPTGQAAVTAISVKGS